MSDAPPPVAPRRPHGLLGTVGRYTTGSVVATLAAQGTFLLLYGTGTATAGVASTVAFVAGAVPNYLLNRRWTWGRRGRVDVRGELLPYVAIVGVSLVVTVAATAWADRLLAGLDVGGWVRTVLVWGAFAGIQGSQFVAKFLIYDRWLFADRPPRPR